MCFILFHCVLFNSYTNVLMTFWPLHELGSYYHYIILLSKLPWLFFCYFWRLHIIIRYCDSNTRQSWNIFQPQVRTITFELQRLLNRQFPDPGIYCFSWFCYCGPPEHVLHLRWLRNQKAKGLIPASFLCCVFPPINHHDIPRGLLRFGQFPEHAVDSVIKVMLVKSYRLEKWDASG